MLRQKILTLLMQPQPQRPEALPGARTLSDATNITGGPSTRLYKAREVSEISSVQTLFSVDNISLC